MHRATSAFHCNREKPLPLIPTETTQTEIQPLFCGAAGSVTSGTTDDTGIESCSLGASPTLPPQTLYPADKCAPITVGAAFKPVLAIREQPPPIPPKAGKIPPLPPKSVFHGSVKDSSVERDCFLHQVSPRKNDVHLSIPNRVEINGIVSVRSSGSPCVSCKQCDSPRQTFYHQGTTLSDQFSCRPSKMTTERFTSMIDPSKPVCHTIGSRRTRQDPFRNPEERLDHDKCRSVSANNKEKLQKVNLEQNTDFRNDSPCSKQVTPLRACHLDSLSFQKKGVKNPYTFSHLNKHTHLQRSGLNQSSSALCSCQLNRHWETKALPPLPLHEVSSTLCENKILGLPEKRNQGVSVPSLTNAEFSRIRHHTSLTKSGCGGLQWLSHTLTRIFKLPSSREIIKSSTLSESPSVSGCSQETRTLKKIDCNIKGYQGIACSNVLCGESLWHRRSKSCTTPKVSRSQLKAWTTKELSKSTAPLPIPTRNCSSPLPGQPENVCNSHNRQRHMMFKSHTTGRPLTSATPLSLDSELFKDFQENTVPHDSCLDHNLMLKSEHAHPLPPNVTDVSPRPHISTCGRVEQSLDYNFRQNSCPCQQTLGSNIPKSEKLRTSSQHVRCSTSSNSPSKHSIFKTGSLDRTVSVDGQTHRPNRSLPKRRLRQSLYKKRKSSTTAETGVADPSSPSLASSYSDSEMPEEFSTTAGNAHGGLAASPTHHLVTALAASQCCTTGTTVCDLCSNSFQQQHHHQPSCTTTTGAGSCTSGRASPATLVIMHTDDTVQLATTGSCTLDYRDREEVGGGGSKKDCSLPVDQVHHVHHIHHVHHFHHHHHHHHHHSRPDLSEATASITCTTGTASPLDVLLAACDHLQHNQSCRRRSCNAMNSAHLGGGTRLSGCLSPDMVTSEPSLIGQSQQLSTGGACHTYSAYDSCVASNPATRTNSSMKSRFGTALPSRPGSCCSTTCCSCTQPQQQQPQQQQRIRSPPQPALTPSAAHLQPILESASVTGSTSKALSPISTTFRCRESNLTGANSATCAGGGGDNDDASRQTGNLKPHQTSDDRGSIPCSSPSPISSPALTGGGVSSDRSNAQLARSPGPSGDGPPTSRTACRSRTHPAHHNGTPVRANSSNTTTAAELQDNRSSFQRSMLELRKMGWYWGPLSFQEAQILLAKRPDGTFLVRDSGHDTYILSLSFRVRGETYHTRIEHNQGRFSFWSQPQSHSANTMIEFIEKAVAHSISGQFHYFLQSSAQGQPPVEVPLLYPLSRFQVVSSLRHLARFTILSSIRRDHIDQLPLPKGLLSYLKEKQCYVESLVAFEEAIRDRPPLEFRPRSNNNHTTSNRNSPLVTCARDFSPSDSPASRSRSVNNTSVGSTESGSSQRTVRNSSQPSPAIVER